MNTNEVFIYFEALLFYTFYVKLCPSGLSTENLISAAKLKTHAVFISALQSYQMIKPRGDTIIEQCKQHCIRQFGETTAQQLQQTNVNAQLIDDTTFKINQTHIKTKHAPLLFAYWRMFHLLSNILIPFNTLSQDTFTSGNFYTLCETHLNEKALKECVDTFISDHNIITTSS